MKGAAMPECYIIAGSNGAGKTTFAREFLPRYAHCVNFMLYPWIPSADMAIERVRDRVESGGHNVPEQAVRRRYTRTLRNLFTLYRPHLDSLHFFDNSTDEPQLVFHDNHGKTTIIDRDLYDRILALIG